MFFNKNLKNLQKMFFNKNLKNLQKCILKCYNTLENAFNKHLNESYKTLFKML